MAKKKVDLHVFFQFLQVYQCGVQLNRPTLSKSIESKFKLENLYISLHVLYVMP